MDTKVCVTCGKQFETRSKKQETCSYECCYTRYMMNCIECGKEIRSRNEKPKRCNACFRKHHNQLTTERAREKRLAAMAEQGLEPAPVKFIQAAEQDEKMRNAAVIQTLMPLEELQACHRCKHLAVCTERIWEVRYLPPCCSPTPVMLHELLAAGINWDERSNVRSVNRAMASVEGNP